MCKGGEEKDESEEEKSEEEDEEEEVEAEVAEESWTERNRETIYYYSAGSSYINKYLSTAARKRGSCERDAQLDALA